MMDRAVSKWVLALTVSVGLAAPSVAQPGVDYSPSVRPDPEGTPTRVEMRVFLLDVISINDLDQEFSADIYVKARWRDPRLALEETTGARERMLPLAAVWQPMLGVLNRRSMETVLPDAVTVDGEGNVFYTQRFIGTFASQLDLRDFPSDRQTLEIRLASYRYGPDELDLEMEIETRWEEALEPLTLAGWNLGGLEAETAAMTIPGSERVGAVLRLVARRDAKYYKLTMVFPLLLIALMAWTVFWIDPSVFPSRVGISTASVFTMIAFRLSLSVKLPKVSYLTDADWFVLIITFLVFGALGETVYAGRQAKNGREERALRVDAFSRWIYLGALAIICAFIVL
jgi:hypothetical protein